MGNLTGLFPGPFAGPEMRKKYAVAVGNFLVAFNALENAVRRTIEIILQQHQREDLLPSLHKDYFVKQVTTLQLLSLSIPDFPDLPYDRMTAINGRRNTVAHGHFDQDLFSEAYKVVGRGKPAEVTVEEIERDADEAIDLLHEIESAWAFLWFDDLDAAESTVHLSEQGAPGA
ncbi:hypothetical protein GOD90_27135 [Sinorhizobium medicae]|nr:hypothetical protein [Sinorhizobium medicae]MDX0716510.1 hypothetical protein [Sinorhizobium medicae]MDX0846204.1 hypothetical protein [Sinorhizobium medicae]MDX0900606.1 hypothetical protein [Sinorhizobium medicae]